MKDSQHGDGLKLAEKLGLSKSKFSELLSYQKIPSEIRQNLIHDKVRSRELLRKLSSSDPNKAKELLDSPSSETKDSIVSREFRTKTLLKIYMDSGSMRVQRRAIKNLDEASKKILKQRIQEIMDIL